MTASVITAGGEISGIQREDHVEFRGIPYAEQPIGVGRFKAPEPLLPDDEPRLADRFADACPQEEVSIFGISQMSEDCLYLNIWTPDCDNKKRPVMVWIHGGGYQTGSGAQLIYRGGNLAVHGDVVVVTLNYRLGAFGFLYLNDLIPAHYNVSANNGLLDQIEALKWIQQNIASFGGDPSQVTLFGESAGAMAIASLMACPAANGLFRRAILQSGSADQVLTRDEATLISARFLEAAEINPAQPDKLWQLTPKQIVKAQRECLKLTFDRGIYAQPVPQTGMTLVPVVDGTLLPQPPLRALEQGAAAHIPLLVGYTRDEWNLFLRLPGAEKIMANESVRNIDKLGLIKLCEKNLPGMGERAANLYEKIIKGRNPGASFTDLFSAFESDRVFRIPSLRIGELQSSHSNDVFMCQFNWDKGLLGACHASDIPLVFGCADNGVGQFLTGGGEGAKKLSKAVQSSWIAFARSGNPATDRVGQWPPFKRDTRKTMCFDETIQLQDDPLEQEREMWEGVL
jgi:para-nitrobenzyl esterase